MESVLIMNLYKSKNYKIKNYEQKGIIHEKEKILYPPHLCQMKTWP